MTSDGKISNLKNRIDTLGSFFNLITILTKYLIFFFSSLAKFISGIPLSETYMAEIFIVTSCDLKAEF